MESAFEPKPNANAPTAIKSARLHENQETARYAGRDDERCCANNDLHYRHRHTQTALVTHDPKQTSKVRPLRKPVVKIPTYPLTDLGPLDILPLAPGEASCLVSVKTPRAQWL
jgi:hypothetical protein